MKRNPDNKVVFILLVIFVVIPLEFLILRPINYLCRIKSYFKKKMFKKN